MNKPRFVFVIFKMFFPANVGGSELESDITRAQKLFCLCFTLALVDI